MAEIEVVSGADGVCGIGPAGGVLTAAISHEGGDPGLVQGGPVLDQITEGVADQTHVVAEPRSGIPHRPAAFIL
jgi:hypothetical protein